MNRRVLTLAVAFLAFSASAFASCVLEGTLTCPTRLVPGQSGMCTLITTNSGTATCDGGFGTFVGLESVGTLGTVSSNFYSSAWILAGPALAYNIATPASLGRGQSFTVTFEVTAPTGVSVAPQISAFGASVFADSDPNSDDSSQTAVASFVINAEEPPPPPPVQVAITRTPSAMLQSENTGGATESLGIKNNGTSVTPALTLSASSDFFTLETTTLTLQPGETRTIGITGRARPAGVYEGVVTAEGTGQNPPPTAQVRLLSAARPDGPVDAVPVSNRVDVAAEGSVDPTGIIPILNRGTGTLRGVLSSDVPWILPQSGLITIPPGQTVNVSFVCERGKRSPFATGFGSAVGSVSLTYDPGTPRAKYASHQTSPPATSRLVTVVDTVRPVVTETVAPPLRQGEVALFAPGVGRVQGSVGLFLSDVSLLNVRPAGSANVSLFYKSLATPPGATGKLVSIPSLPPLTSLGLADIVKGIFGSDGEVGSLQIRTFDPGAISVGATIFNSSDPRGSFGTSVPVFRSDRGASAGQELHLTGLRKSSSSHTNIYLQEMSGTPINVMTSFFNAGGGLISSRPDTIGAFGTLFMNSPVPEGAVTARLQVLDGSTGRLQAYATPVDDASGDFWSVPDWSRYYNYAPTEALIIPVAGAVRGANNSYFRTDVSFTNRGAATAQGFLRYHERGSSAPIERFVSLPGLQSISYDDVVTTLFGITRDTVGYLLFTPTAGNMAVTSRTYTTVAGQAATFGTGVPAMPLSSSLGPGDARRIGGLEDASLPTIVAGRPGTFRTNVGIVETGGAQASVRVTARFTYSAGASTARIAEAKTYELGPRQFLLINNITRDILGSSRDTTFGDIRNLALDFEVISQSGSVVVFTSATDNGTNDTVLRTE